MNDRPKGMTRLITMMQNNRDHWPKTDNQYKRETQLYNKQFARLYGSNTTEQTTNEK